ncbi:MAG TPA: hypothetical protein VF263_17190 [Longimicrobiaceae bacterium]
MRARAALLLLGLGACAPTVTHAPRVEPGSTVGATLGVRPGACDSSCSGAGEPAPALGVFFRHGWTSADSAGAAFSVGVFVPGAILVPVAELDLYAQAPSAPGAPVLGGGVLLAADHLMPYLQAGKTARDGSGWYTTQGAAFTSETSGSGVSAAYWAPAVAYRLGWGDRGVHLYLSGGVGRKRTSVYGEGATRTRSGPLRFLMLGAVLERRIAWRDLLPGPPPRPVPHPGWPPPRVPDR